MNDPDRTGKIVSLVFNIVLFTVVLGMIGVSLYVVFENKPEILAGLSDPFAPIGSTVQVEPSSTEEGDSSSLAIEIPPEGILVTKELELEDSLLINPGIGWIYRWTSRQASEIPSTVAYGERGDLSWRILNPAEGQFNWSPLDAQLQTAVSEGKQFSFRVYTMVGESIGGHQVPQWVIDNGARILDSGEPDYSNCIYQDAWGRFVNELVNRYDGNPNIAFIDISGYGNFNEWSWVDQTEWDNSWEAHYNQGTASKYTLTTIDGQARRRLADMFIGGDFIDHTCRAYNNELQYVNYEYPGFQKTQLVLPYAGIIQATQYVFTQRKDVGFRHDCLGRLSSEDMAERLENELAVIHQQAPIVFETCSDYNFEMLSAYRLLSNIPASLIHNANIHDITTKDIAGLTKSLGYRYYLSEITHGSFVAAGDVFYIKMSWSNLGNSPNYPMMGQDFELHVYLVPQGSGKTVDLALNTDITKWQPSTLPGGIQPIVNEVEKAVRLPDDLAPGNYDLWVAIIDLRTGNPILLANNGRGGDGYYQVSEIEVIGE